MIRPRGIVLLTLCSLVVSRNCRDTVKDTDISYIEWHNLRPCLDEINGESLPTNTSANIWRLTKMAFRGIENIPLEEFRHLGYALTAIGLDELRQLNMERVEIVEAFGAVRSSEGRHPTQGFSAEQASLVAHKVRTEWLGKGPETYSEYDLISLGEILCHLNASDIEALHPDAFKNAIEWIGNIENCPQDRLEALAKLAMHPDVFGEPNTWSKLDVSLVGNILNGLSQAEISLIDPKKLHLNRFHVTRRVNPKGEGKTIDGSIDERNDTSTD